MVEVIVEAAVSEIAIGTSVAVYVLHPLVEKEKADDHVEVPHPVRALTLQ